MKYLFIFLAVLAVIFFAPPVLKRFNSQQLHGTTEKKILESAKDVRRNLPTEQRHTFDVAFGLLKQFKASEGENAFTTAVGGKSPAEVIDLAKQEVEKKIAAGDPEFKEFRSFDDMLSKEAARDAPKRAASALPPPPLRDSTRTGRPN